LKNNKLFLSAILVVSLLIGGLAAAAPKSPPPDDLNIKVPLPSVEPWIDRSHTIFLPSGLRKNLSTQFELPYFWWNFLVIDAAATGPDFVLAEELCGRMVKMTGEWLQKTACPGVQSFFPVVEQWSKDVFLRRDAYPLPTLKDRFENSMTKATLPMDRELLEILRIDPLEAYTDLKSLLMKNVEMGLAQSNGFFVDAKTNKIVIPFQMNFSPQETSKTKEVCAKFAKMNNVALVGPHISSMENERQIMDDIDKVSMVGLIILAVQFLFIFITMRFRYFLLIPPVLAGVGAGAILTVMIFGSIHGLAVSFGAGLIALALDFGLHSCHNVRWRGVWRANLYGLLTTFAGLLAISLSSIPLLQQMMVFASIGLLISYVIFYFLHSLFPGTYSVQPFRYAPTPGRIKAFAVFTVVGLSFFGFLFVRPNLDMQQFDYQTPRTRQTLYWLYSLIHQQMPLFSVNDRGPEMFDVAQKQIQAAEQNHVELTNLLHFMPAPAQQEKNLASWKSYCGMNIFSKDQRILFAPFMDEWPCEQSPPLFDEDSPIPTYLRDTMSEKSWLTVWFPKTPDDIVAIRAADKNAFSLRDIVQQFPDTLALELRWMVPLSMLLCMLLLWLYYQDITLSLVSLIPFFTGTGLYFGCVIFFGWGFSFISIIALIMVFGFSLDYGIFATNLYSARRPPSADGVWTCLLLGSAVTILGFLPLIFCQHPVLVHLGQALTIGTLGTYIGTAWGIPGFFELRDGLL